MVTQDNKNTWLSESSKELIDFYINAADVIVIERKRIIKLLLDIFAYHFKDKTNLKILDLGCGDGTVTKSFINRYPDNQYFLIDGSRDMLNKARSNLNEARNVTFIHQSFEEYIDNEDDTIKYNFIFSSNAIHHLNAAGKAKLYFKIYLTLNPGGLFINFDVVQPPSERTEQWQFQMWRDWMNEKLIEIGKSEDIGKHDGLPDLYKSKDDNLPSPLFDQLQLLDKIGFKDVDCFYKYGIFTLFGGTK